MSADDDSFLNHAFVVVVRYDWCVSCSARLMPRVHPSHGSIESQQSWMIVRLSRFVGHQTLVV